MSRRYPYGMRQRLSFVLCSALLLMVATDAAAQVRTAATASARIAERPVRIVAADLRRDPRQLPPQAQLSQRRCDPGAPPGCRMIVVEMP
jgi:hypothetical protein